MAPTKQSASIADEAKKVFKAAWRTLYDTLLDYSETVVEGETKAAEPAESKARPPAKARGPVSRTHHTIPQAPKPDELYPGAHEQPGGYIAFVLFAPMKRSVALAGSFNGWNAEAAPMQPTQQGLWWVTLKLPEGRHLYQFVVDGERWICDPYAREVSWDGNGPKAVIEVGAQPYEWGDASWDTPALHDAIIYEVHVGDFSPEGTFEAMRQRLDYIQSLGVNAIELMPIFEFPMDRSWGYNPAFFFAPEHAYGRPDDLKRLIDEAHQRGMAVVLDVVFNHSQQDNPLNQLWSYEDNPYFSGGNPWGMPDFDHFSDVTKTFVRDVQEFWLREYHIDGFRYDATAYIESDAMNGIGFFTWAARQVKPDVWLIAEHLPQDPWWIHNSEMDAQWHDTFHDIMKAQLREGHFEGGNEWGDLDKVERALFYAADGFGHPRAVVNYVSSHDEQRVIHEVLSNPHLNHEIAWRKAKLGMATVIGAAGVPMLYSGEEIGMDRERSTDHVPFEWERLAGDPDAQGLLRHWQRLTWLRNTHPALRAPGYETCAKWHAQKAIAFKRWSDDGDVVIVVLNFSNDTFHLPFQFPAAGTWHEYLYQYDQPTDSNGVATIELPPSGAKFFCWIKNW